MEPLSGIGNIFEDMSSLMSPLSSKQEIPADPSKITNDVKAWVGKLAEAFKQLEALELPADLKDRVKVFEGQLQGHLQAFNNLLDNRVFKDLGTIKELSEDLPSKDIIDQTLGILGQIGTFFKGFEGKIDELGFKEIPKIKGLVEKGGAAALQVEGALGKAGPVLMMCQEVEKSLASWVELLKFWGNAKNKLKNEGFSAFVDEIDRQKTADLKTFLSVNNPKGLKKDLKDIRAKGENLNKVDRKDLYSRATEAIRSKVNSANISKALKVTAAVLTLAAVIVMLSNPGSAAIGVLLGTAAVAYALILVNDFAASRKLEGQMQALKKPDEENFAEEERKRKAREVE